MDYADELASLQRQLEREKRRADRAESDGEYEACRQLIIYTQARIDALINRATAAPFNREVA